MHFMELYIFIYFIRNVQLKGRNYVKRITPTTCIDAENSYDFYDFEINGSDRILSGYECQPGPVDVYL